MAARRRLTNEQRTVYAERSWSEGKETISKEAGVSPATVDNWRRKFAPQGNDAARSADSCTSEAIAEASADATAAIARDDIETAFAPDKQAPSYWQARNYLARADYAEFSLGPLRRDDGTHFVVFSESDIGYSPRDDVDDLFHGLGTLAVLGDCSEMLGDSTDSCRECDARVDWWTRMRDNDIEEAIPWMLRAMRNEELDEDEGDWSDECPSEREMNEAATAYHQNTGNYAFPLYQKGRAQHAQLEITNPSNTDDSGKTFGCIPVGFAFLTAAEAETISSENWNDAYENLAYAVETHNDYLSGLDISVTYAIFDNDGDNESPVEAIGSGHYPNRCLQEVVDDCVSSALGIVIA